MAIRILDLEDVSLIDFRLYGIASSYTDPAQFVYHLNLNFISRFTRIEDLDLIVEGENVYYPVFEWEDLNTGGVYHLIKNSAYTYTAERNSNDLYTMFEVSPVLIRSMKEYNFLLKETGFCGTEELRFKENHFIQQVSAIEVHKLKQADRLIF